MSVHFSETPLESLLAPVWARSTAAGSTQDSPTLAVLCRGLDAGYSPSQVAVWLRKAHPDVASRGESWFRLVSSARKHVGASSSFLLAGARAGIGHLLSPAAAAGQPRTIAADKQILLLAMSVAAASAEQRMDTFFITDTWLAKLTGRSAGAAQQARKRLVGRGWIRPVSKRGMTMRYRLGRLDEVGREGAWYAGATVDALAAGHPELDPLAQILITTRHPGWWYALSGRHLLAAVARATDLPPEVFGLSARAYRALIKGVPEGDPGGWLDPLALERGAFEAADRREKEMAAESAKRAASLAAFRAKRVAENAVKLRSRGVLKEAWAVVGVPPKAGAPREEAEAWMQKAQTLFREHPLPAELAEIVPTTIAGQLSWRGWEPAVAQRMAGFVVGGDPDTAGVA